MRQRKMGRHRPGFLSRPLRPRSAPLWAACALALGVGRSALGAEPANDAGSRPAQWGVGYAASSLLGAAAGSVLFRPDPHWTVDLRGSYLYPRLSRSGATGFALAPTLEFGSCRPGRHECVVWPYVALGGLYRHLGLQQVSAGAAGAIAKVGFQLRWDVGLAFHLAYGIAYSGQLRATDGTTTIDDDSGFDAKYFELGLRYMF